jgi:hypothetical protein
MALLAERHRRHRVTARLPAPDGTLLTIRGRHLTGLELLDDGAGQWVLRVPHDTGDVRLTGDAGLRAAGLLLPRVNAAGASAAQVREALDVLDRAGDPLRVFSVVARRPPRGRRVVFGEVFYGADPVGGEVQRLRPAQRLALEMAAHEEAERRAMAGEIAMLEQAWRDAERIAAISDDLLVPATVEQWLHERKATPDA